MPSLSLPTFCLSLTLSVLAIGGPTVAQPVGQAPAPPATVPASVPASGSEAEAARARFDAAVEDYKESIRQIETLRKDFQTADPATQAKINAQLGGLVAAAQLKVETLAAAAREAYRTAPNTDPEITKLLLAMAHHLAIGHPAVNPMTGRPASKKEPMGGDYMGSDQPEKALEVISLLIEGKAAEPKLTAWGGLCAMQVNDYDLAEKYLNLANETGQFAGLPDFPGDDIDPEISFRLKARDRFVHLAELRANWEAEAKIRAAEAAADDLPRVKFTTSKGDVVIELFENEAPIATASMLSLVKKGYYDGIIFHRVLPQFMAQGGDPTGTGSGGPGYHIKCECHQPNARKHFRGSLSMAHAGRDTGGSQFFLTFVPTDFLNGRHTAFGRVIEGMDVLARLQRIDPSAGGPKPAADKIVKAVVLRDRGHGYEFEKLPGR